MLAKWAEDDRQAKIKEEQRRLKMLEYRELCNKLDLERHKNSISEKVCLSVCLCLTIISVFFFIFFSPCMIGRSEGNISTEGAVVQYFNQTFKIRTSAVYFLLGAITVGHQILHQMVVG